MSITFGVKGFPENAPELNVSNTNGMAIQRMLGMEPDYCGSLDPSQLLAALAVANPGSIVRESHDNMGVDVTVDGVKPIVRIIECGLSEDRIEFYIERLTRIAEHAVRHGTEITFG